MNRRQFLTAVSAAGLCPAIARAEDCYPRDAGDLIPRLIGDGIENDGPALQAIIDGRLWIDATTDQHELRYGRGDGVVLGSGLTFRTDCTLNVQGARAFTGVQGRSL